jgi:ABC-type transport system involved in multi-copper enzyme maturation permease subunit
MLPGPVFNIELITTARRARYYVIRFAYGMLLLFFLWQNNPELYSRSSRPVERGMSIQEMAAFGRAIFNTFLTVQGAAVLFLTPSLVAGVIADEKQRKTLHYLLASRLTSGEIIVGKLAARLLHVGIFLTIGLPVLSLVSLFGGVDPQLVLISYAATLTTTVFLASMAILISTLARRPREAIALAYVLELAWLFIPTFLTLTMTMGGPFWVRLYGWIRPVNEWIAPSSPFHLTTLNTSSGPVLFEALLWMMGLQLAYGAVFVLLAMARLRPVFRKEGEGSRWLAAAGRGRRLLPRPECGDDAMLWKERYVSRTSGTTKLVAGLLGLLVGGLLASSVYEYARLAFIELAANGYGSLGSNQARNDLSGFLRLVGTLIYIAWGLAIAVAASSGIAQEREADTWITLVSTPLSGLEIVRAKMFGAFWGLRGLGVLMLGLWLLGVAAGAVHPLAFLAVVVETAVFLWFVAALGLCLSVRAKNSARAMTATVAILIVLNGGYLMCCIPLQPNTPLIAMGVTPFILPISLCTYEEFKWLFTSGFSHSPWHSAELFATCFMGVSAYAVGAFGLTTWTIAQFDEWIERPRRPWTEPPAINLRKPESVEGVDEESLA